MQYVFAACRDTSSTRKRFSRNHIGSDPCIFFMLRKSDRPDSPPFSYFKNKTTDRILGFSNGLRKHRPTGFCVCQENFGPHIAYPSRRMELANFRAEKYANISRAKWVPDWCTFENNVIFGHLQGGSRVCTLLVYFFGGGWGFKLAYTRGFYVVRRPLQLRLLLVLTTACLTRALRLSYI